MSFDVRLRLHLGEAEVCADFSSEARLTALVGPSGVGKTSVLNAIAGLLRPREGRVVAAGQVLFDSAQGTDLAPEARRAGYVFQDGRLFPHLSVRANLAYGERLAAPSERWIARDEVAKLLDIGGLLDRRTTNLSGGEVRRVAIARALLAAPRFLLLDEPTASLDATRAEALLGLIERIRDAMAVPILLVSHSRAEVERLAGNVIEMA